MRTLLNKSYLFLIGVLFMFFLFGCGMADDVLIRGGNIAKFKAFQIGGGAGASTSLTNITLSSSGVFTEVGHSPGNVGGSQVGTGSGNGDYVAAFDSYGRKNQKPR